MRNGDASRTEGPGAFRNPALDIARGLIVALMALDHVRIFFTSAQFDPVDVGATDWGYFLTRWVTHLCAPGFFFIAGAGVHLSERSNPDRYAPSRFLALRGVWLIAAEIAVFGFAWSFRAGWMWFGVIWALGGSFLLLAAARLLPKWLLLLMTLVLLLLLPAVQGAIRLPDSLGALLLHGGMADLPLLGARAVLYPLLPWAALMFAGYASAPYWLRASEPAPARLIVAGLWLIAIFVALRAFGIGGGSAEPYAGSKMLMSFLNVQKYPPSLQFSSLTIGLLALFCGWAAGRSSAGSRAWAPLRDFGRVPFFFYAIHLFLVHGSALAVAAVLGWPTFHLFWQGVWPHLQPPGGYGFGLAGVLIVWLAVLALLWPMCARFGGIKRRHPSLLLRLL